MLRNFKIGLFEPIKMKKKQGLTIQNRSPVQIGWASCTVPQLLQQHRKEVIAIKEQLSFVRERLAA